MYLIFDTETTGLPRNYNAPVTDTDNWPRLVQIAWQLHDNKGNLLTAENYIVKPEGFTIPFNSEKIHGISTKKAKEVGHDLREVLAHFSEDINKSQLLIGHNVEFDINIMGAEFVRTAIDSNLMTTNALDTKTASTAYCAIPGGRGGKFKWPTLTELYTKLFGKAFDDAHDAAYDVSATAKCYFGLIKAKVVSPLDETAVNDITYEAPKLDAANFAKQEEDLDIEEDSQVTDSQIEAPFCHLHVHSQYSVLQATPKIKALIDKAKEMNMPAVALTDLGNMFGVYKFVRDAIANDVKPIVGCEFFVSEDRLTKKFTKDNPDKRFKQILIAKNRVGYHNLVKLSSLGYTEGLYGLYPRIDKALIQQYSEGLIALSGGLGGEIPNLVLNIGEHQAEDAMQWWVKIFEDDFYLELNNHGLPEEVRLNEVLLEFSKKHKVKVIAANETYYLNKEESNAHDVLLCVKEGEFKSTPIGRGRGFRYGFPNNEYYFKSQEEMKTIFKDVPQAIENISELIDKVEAYELKRDVLLPKYDIPSEFVTEDDYLKHITYVGAKKRYKEITDEIKERLDFELETIKKTGYPGYFLIVQDFTTKAREMGIAVGPGRGSAAGSAVAYCTGITNVDPIKYDLLFERFLNPDRVSLPDIDIDFDDEGRDKIIDYVIEKYGKNQVAQIITYGTMAAKSSIRDAGRVMELSLSETNEVAKLVPERPGTTLAKAFKEVPDLDKIRTGGENLKSQVLNQAIILEGSVRNTGTHACGVIITPDDITNFVPVSTQKDSDMLITQFDNSVVENAGMLKMDFLGLKTLSIIKTAVKYIEKGHGVIIDIDTIPLDDEKTYQLYQKGATGGTFQFESEGMQKHLRGLKPDKLADLIAMNALYRPGPMEYIPNFIARKTGKEEIKYDLPEMEEYLAETYGITVYQEQVMRLSQKLAGFSKGDADVLRKAMGKKIFSLLEKLKPLFLDGCKANGHPVEIAEKIWKDWEAFAAYAFNKSHSTCYSIVAYQTGYLKANYPAEYMASVLTHNQNNISKVTELIDECKKQKINVLGPDVNESGVNFEVNKEGEIRFGLGAIKGSGEAAVERLIEERDAQGDYKNLFDFAERLSSKSVNKKTFESLAMAGGFDCFEEYNRRQYLHAENNEATLIEKAIKYANRLQSEKESAQQSLFGGGNAIDIPRPKVENIEPYGELEKLKIEKEVVGFYISGHPLDQFKLEINNFCNTQINQLKDLPSLQHKDIRIAGSITEVAHRFTKNGKPFGTFTIEDYTDAYTIFLFSDNYIKFKEYMVKDWFIYMRGVVAPRWNGGELEFKINSIDLLSDIREKMTDKILINIDTKNVTPQLVTQLAKIGNKYKGTCTMNINLIDLEKNITVELQSRKYQVNPDNEMIAALEQIENISFSIK